MAAPVVPEYVAAERTRREACDARAAAAAAAGAGVPSRLFAPDTPAAQLADDCVATALTFLSLRERCLGPRRVSRAWAAFCASDTLWVQLCHAAGIDGCIVAEDDEADVPEPDLHRPSLQGCNQEARIDYLAPALAAGVAWAARGGCAHLTADRVERLVRSRLSKIHARVFTREAAVGTGGGTAWGDCACGRRANLFCLDCGALGCTRAHNGCMAAHGGPTMQCPHAAGANRNSIGSDVAAASSDSTAPRGLALVGLPRGSPPDEGYCYGCDRPVRVPAGAAWTLPSSCDLPAELARLFSTRSLQLSRTHAALFQRMECPHLDQRAIDCFKRRWAASRKWLTDTNCRGALCNERATFVCVACGDVKCSIGAAAPSAPESPDDYLQRVHSRMSQSPPQRPGYRPLGHMHAHALLSGHVLVIGVRSLTVYCFACDRVLGVGGSTGDAHRAALLRRVIEDQAVIYHQEPTTTAWRFFEPRATTGELQGY